jgi:hypothetical protein
MGRRHLQPSHPDLAEQRGRDRTVTRRGRATETETREAGGRRTLFVVVVVVVVAGQRDAHDPYRSYGGT